MSATIVVLTGLAVAAVAAVFRARPPRASDQPDRLPAAGSSWERCVPAPVLDTSQPVPAELGPYVIERQIGQGAMSRVFRARDTRNGNAVALKVPRFDSADATNLEAFEREFEVGRSLSHVHMVEMYETGWSRDHFYVSLELVQGATLEDLLVHGPLHFHECWELARQLASVLYYAHKHGAVHGDVKPANLMLTPQGYLKMLDFGIAGLAGDEQKDGANSVLGTPEYMAPEVRQRGLRSALSDQYSAGVVLYQVLTGHLPSEGVDRGEMQTIVHWRKKTPPAWIETVEKMLHPEPARRFRDMGAIYELLTREAKRFTG